MNHVRDIADLIETLARSETFHALLIRGPAGLGKSTSVEMALKRLGMSARSLGSYSTPLNLFLFLSTHRSEIVLIDDCAGLFQSSAAMAVLKAATGTMDGPRRVTWGSTKQQQGAQDFEFGGKIIFICNGFPDGADADALRSRSIAFDLEFSKDEASQILLEAARVPEFYKDTDIALKVAEFLNARRSDRNSDLINLRTLKMGYEMAQSQPDGRWQQLLVKLVPSGAVADPEIVVRELDASGLQPKAQQAEFLRRTGMKRRTFFKLRRELGLAREYVGREKR